MIQVKEISQMIKYLLHKHKNLVGSPEQTHTYIHPHPHTHTHTHRKARHGEIHLSSQYRRCRGRQVPGLHWSASLAYLAYSWSRRDLASRDKRDGGLKLTSSFQIDNYASAHL